MKRESYNAPEVPQPKGGYSQVVTIEGHKRLAFVSGQVPEGLDGDVPTDFLDQARLAWANVDAQLKNGGMDKDDIIKVNIFLSDRKYALANREARAAYLGDLRPAMSVIICGIFDEKWLLEIEAVAAR